jgi:hypothetical protein
MFEGHSLLETFNGGVKVVLMKLVPWKRIRYLKNPKDGVVSSSKRLVELVLHGTKSTKTSLTVTAVKALQNISSKHIYRFVFSVLY